MIDTELHIGADHPALAGHFPDRPIVPGVVLLDEAVRAIELHLGQDFVLRHRLASVKFRKPVGPDARLVIRVDLRPDSQIAFSIDEDGQPVASGRFVPHGRDAPMIPEAARSAPDAA